MDLSGAQSAVTVPTAITPRLKCAAQRMTAPQIDFHRSGWADRPSQLSQRPLVCFLLVRRRPRGRPAGHATSRDPWGAGL